MKGETQFTPGPWFTFANDHCVGGPESQPGAGQGIAMCSMRARTEDEIVANARLIAAAPDLHSALEGLVRIVDAMRMTTGLGKSQTLRLEAARAALSRARGEAQGDRP